jgi:hypothetical protein
VVEPDETTAEVETTPSSVTGVMVLIAFLLVVVAQVLRVAGVLSDGIALILVSIGASSVAAVVLIVAVFRGRRNGKPPT